jgi:hypothetical protein
VVGTAQGDMIKRGDGEEPEEKKKSRILMNPKMALYVPFVFE